MCGTTKSGMKSIITFEEQIQGWSIEHLRDSYNLNAVVDWYKANAIVAEIKRRDAAASLADPLTIFPDGNI